MRIIFEENNIAKFLLDSFFAGLDEEILQNIEIENYSRTHQKGPYRFAKGTKKKAWYFQINRTRNKAKVCIY